MSKGGWYGLGSLGLVGLGIAGWLAYGGSSKGSKPRYETASVARGHVIAKISATGTLSPLKTVQVGSQVSGRILEIHADFNDAVKKDQVIARLDPQLISAEVKRARANLAAASADLRRAQALANNARKQSDRLASLAGRKLVSDAEADTAKSTAEAQDAQVIGAQGAVAQASAAVSQAELNLTYTTIYSPIDGVVISRSVDVGQTVAASFQAPTLFTIAEDLRKMQVDTNVAEGDVGKLSNGLPVTFTVDAYPGRSFKGAVRQVRNAPTTVNNVVTYDAVIDVDNPDLALKPGMTANVTFVVGDRDGVLTVPNAALRFKPAGAPAIAAAGPAPTGGAPAAEPASGASPTSRPARGAKRDNKEGGDGPRPRTIYKLVAGEPQPIKVKVGISDGTNTEIVEALDGATLNEGDAIVTDQAGGGDKGASGQQGGAPRPRLGF